MKPVIHTVLLLGTLSCSALAHALCEPEVKTVCDLVHGFQARDHQKVGMCPASTPDKEIAAAQGDKQKLEAGFQRYLALVRESARRPDRDTPGAKAELNYYACMGQSFENAKRFVNGVDPFALREQGDKYFESNQIEQGLAAYRKAADMGDILSQLTLGEYYANQNDLPQAASWYEKAAAQGNGMGMFRFGYCLLNGLGVKQDTGKAMELLTQAADREHNVEAMMMLCSEYLTGTHQAQDITRGIAYLTKASEIGHPVAQYLLGNLYSEGQGVTKDTAKAINLWKKSAAQGYEPAKEALQAHK